MFEPRIRHIELVAFLEQLSRRIIEEPHPFVSMSGSKRASDDATQSHNEKRTLCDHVYSLFRRHYSPLRPNDQSANDSGSKTNSVWGSPVEERRTDHEPIFAFDGC